MHGMTSSAPLLHIVDQHVEEAGHLSHVRPFVVASANLRLQGLLRHDQRLAAHLDGIAVAGDAGWQACEQALGAGAPSAAFTAGACAIESADAHRIERMLSLAQALPEARRSLAEVFNWVSAQWLAGLIRNMLSATSPVRRALALHACATHRVDPGDGLARALDDVDDELRCIALRCAGEVGKTDLRDACVEAARDSTSGSTGRFWAARSALMLGERHVSSAVLNELAASPGPWRQPSLEVVLKVIDARQAAALLQPLRREPGGQRALIRGIGMLGDPAFVPWLIECMAEPTLARLAGESMALIVGCELDHPDLLLRTPEGDLAAPAEIGEDEPDIVPIEHDDGLPLPDAARVAAWWAREGSRFTPGSRVLVGAPPSSVQCVALLRGGRQRQRAVAAEHLMLAVPGNPLFNTAAPAWRQARWLGNDLHGIVSESSR